ncbi:hypothetical protein L226DRAFT_202527 [Lentinus tigrinus ALCF2SS1-7]|uniref:uncharacterized protein n=1 Tax=Lentinus tigrinus ALCF2SS1-7 TaxID=1328758 RepID=UPI0011660707|nr:hypothetical protein L226DRAFT_202527 [Lentinus tigrinus ALCF2SS1-7]
MDSKRNGPRAFFTAADAAADIGVMRPSKKNSQEAYLKKPKAVEYQRARALLRTRSSKKTGTRGSPGRCNRSEPAPSFSQELSAPPPCPSPLKPVKFSPFHTGAAREILVRMSIGPRTVVLSAAARFTAGEVRRRRVDASRPGVRSHRRFPTYHLTLRSRGILHSDEVPERQATTSSRRRWKALGRRVLRGSRGQDARRGHPVLTESQRVPPGMACARSCASSASSPRRPPFMWVRVH